MRTFLIPTSNTPNEFVVTPVTLIHSKGMYWERRWIVTWSPEVMIIKQIQDRDLLDLLVDAFWRE
ncbi:hypothetical protein N7492_008272 [Penicillium capsulatum]|uniref:Uncharacterized protein n=1 Tax=Penicillium capsulatum TaxID=69766 RepID=A0A9W9HSB8_9EURO|nr:hypothetical protein N7492_008272 [Penicillium capsulatum]KAJ6105681.1 hypothetical protein N7512_009198 [Penicillium capsulatum]